MTKKIRSSLALIALFSVLFFSACYKRDDPFHHPKYVERIQKDSMTVDFPPGSVLTSRATLQKVSDPVIQYAFDETADNYRAIRKSPFQYILDISTQPPQNDSIVVTVKLPSTISKSSIPADYAYELFAQVIQDGGEETLDLFTLIPSVYNSSDNTLIATLPAWVFTNKRNAAKTYQAIFTIAATPGAPVTITNTSQLTRLAPTLRAAAAAAECLAGQISCPIGSIDDCTAKKTSPFGVRVDPVTGKAGSVHWGLDFGVPTGTPVHAVSDGKIERLKPQTDINGKVIGYGLYIVVRHTDGSASLYAHLSSTNVKLGDLVSANQQIAISDNSGKSTGPHLHFEYFPNGAIVKTKNEIDPSPCISAGNANGSITIRDNGNLADDAFELYLDNVLIGKTAIGASNSVALSNLRPGDKTLTLTCIVAPDNVGTYEVVLNDGITFKDDGGTIKSDILPMGGSISWPINIPASARPNLRINLSRPNKYIER